MTRLAVCALLFGASLVLVAHRAEPVAAQTKAGQKIETLQAELVQANQVIAALKQELNQLQATNKKLQADQSKTAKADDKSAKTLQGTIDGYKNAGLVHVVILKLKPDSPQSEVQSLIDETYSQLAKIKTVRGVWAGKPAAKGTPDVAATDYTVALGFVFDDADGLKKYLDDPVHTKFVDKHLKKWETPVVYDFEPKKVAAP